MTLKERWLGLYSRLRSRLLAGKDTQSADEQAVEVTQGYADGEDFPEEIEWYPIEGAPWEEVCDGAQGAFGECDDFFG